MERDSRIIKRVYEFIRRVFFSLKLKKLIKSIDKIEAFGGDIGKNLQWAERVLKNVSDAELARKVVGLKYRYNILNKTYAAPQLCKSLFLRADLWKKRQPFSQGSELNREDREHLQEASQYPEFAKLILHSKKLEEKFLNWVIRDHNHVRPFIEFPHTADLIMESNLSLRIGRINKNYLKIEESSAGKILTLPFEGKDIDIRNPNRLIAFKNDLVMSVSQVFDVFKNKEFEAGPLEFMNEGIINWNSFFLGPLNPKTQKWESLSVKKMGWWDDLPLFETLSLAELRVRYDVIPKKGEWVAFAVSTRSSNNLDFINTHSFLKVAIPCGSSQYRLYDFGKFARELPKNPFDTLKMLCKISEAVISYPDENVFYMFREKGFQSFILTELEGIMLMSEIANDIEHSRNRSLVYQIESENCAKWVHEKLASILGKASIPDLFWMPLLETEPDGFVKWIFRFIKWLPRNIQVRTLAYFHIPLGAFQETPVYEKGVLVTKSLIKHEFFRHGHIFHPALLIQRTMDAKEQSRLAFERYLWSIKHKRRGSFSLARELHVLGKQSMQFTYAARTHILR